MKEDERCLSSAPMPFGGIKRCQKDKLHGDAHKWAETSEGHSRVPVVVLWDDQKNLQVVEGTL